MKADEIFGIVVRTLGSWIIVQMVLKLPAAFSSPTGVIGIVMEAMLGFYVFFRADFIVDLAYRHVRRQPLDPLAPR